MAVFIGAQPHTDLHLVPRAAGNLGFLPGIDQFGRAAGLHRDKGGVDLADGGLLRAEAAADPRFLHPDAAHRDAERAGENPPAVENNLGRGDHVQPAVAVKLGVGAEGLHHRLVEGFGVVGTVDDDVAVCEYSVDVAAVALVARDKVAAVVAADRAGGHPVFLRVDKDGVILRGAEIEHGFEDFILDLDELHRPQGGFLVLGRDDRDGVARKPDVPVKDQPVIRRGFGVGLARDREPVLGHILPGVDGHNAGNF